MKFRTEISMDASPYPLGYKKRVLMLGSCFTEYIGARLHEALFHVMINPFGVTYNPLSMGNNILALLEKEDYKEEDLDYFNELWFSFDHYTLFSGTDKAVVLKGINERFLEAKMQLKQATHLVLTFGTAYIYESKDKGQLVNNCHKIPAREFNRRMITVQEIIAYYSELIERLTNEVPGIKIDFTVSPVRHIKDGLTENQMSKASLLLAIKELLNKFPETCTYFPAYEMMMDDLRDYRFYTSDLVHPNAQAVEYIWGKFKETRLDHESIEILKEIASLVKAEQHRLLHPKSKASIIFQEKTAEKRKELSIKYPFLNWSKM